MDTQAQPSHAVKLFKNTDRSAVATDMERWLDDHAAQGFELVSVTYETEESFDTTKMLDATGHLVLVIMRRPGQ